MEYRTDKRTDKLPCNIYMCPNNNANCAEVITPDICYCLSDFCEYH